MLTKSELNAAWPLAEALTARGVTLRVLPNTPLSELVSASLVNQQVVNAIDPRNPVEGVGDVAQNLLDSSTAADATGTVLHDAVMSRSVEAVSKAVEKNLNLAQNVVKPMIEQVVNDTTAYMDAQAQSSLAPLTVVPFYYPELFDSPIFADMVGFAKETAAQDMALALTLGAPVDGYAAALKTGAARFDEEIAQFVLSVGEEEVKAVWSLLFEANGAKTLFAAIQGRYDQINRQVIAYLLSRRLLEDIPEGVNMELPAYRAYMSTLMAQSAAMVCRAMQRRKGDVRMKTLVIDKPEADQDYGRITVVGDVYQDFLQDGGSPEALYGCQLSDRDFAYVNLIANKDRFERVWKGTFAMLQTRREMVRFSALIEGLRQAVNQALLTVAPEYRTLEAAVYQDRLKERLGKVKAKDVNELWHTARKVVCRVIFPHTDAERVLNAIDAACQSHPELEVREAALYGTIDFVTSWVAQLFQVAPTE